MTVVAPIVSQACIFRTRLFVFSILRILNARLNVTLIGRPSGTATTIRVTAIIKYCRMRPAVSSVKILSAVNAPVKISLVSKPINVAPATIKPTILMNLASFSNCLLSGVLSLLISVDFSATFPNSVASPTFSIR